MKFKSPILCACVLLSACAVDANDPVTDEEPVASSEDALCKNALSPTQEQAALKLIDDICGDTWCEGDNNFAFQRLTCTEPHRLNPGTCTLKLRIIPRDAMPASRPFYNRSCTTAQFAGFDSLVATAQNGYQSLQPEFYDALSECISNLEAALPH
jgi:hypothetical protein